MAAAGSSSQPIELGDSPDPPVPPPKRSRRESTKASTERSLTMSEMARRIPEGEDRDRAKFVLQRTTAATTLGGYLRGLAHSTPEAVVEKCRNMLTVGIDMKTCSGEKHALAKQHCRAAKLSIVTNQQGFQHTVDGWAQFGAEFGIDRYLPHVVNALPTANVLTDRGAGVAALPPQYKTFCASLFDFCKEKVPVGQAGMWVGFGFPTQMLLDLGKFDPNGCIDPRKARRDGSSSIAEYEKVNLPYGAPRASKTTNAAYKASHEHKDGSAIYEIELRKGVASTVVGRLHAVAFDYPEHIGAPTRESSICRAYAYSRLLRGAPTVKNVLHIVYEHCV